MTDSPPPSLRAIAAEIRPLSRLTAERLESLARAIETASLPTPWAAVELEQAIDPNVVAALIRNAPLRNIRLARLEVARNVLALVPIFLTWLALSLASFAYQQAIALDPTLAQSPFLLLWEQRFDGRLTGLLGIAALLNLSLVAFVDAVVLLVVIVLSFLIHREINVLQTGLERRATATQDQLTHALWDARMQLAARSAPEVQRDQFRLMLEDMLNTLRAERQIFHDQVAQREEDRAALSGSVSEFSKSVQEMSQLLAAFSNEHSVLISVGANLYDLIDPLQRSVLALARVIEQEAEPTRMARAALVRSVEASQAVLGRLLTATGDLAEQLGGAADQLLDAIDSSSRAASTDREHIQGSVSEAAARLGAAISEATRALATLQEQVLTSGQATARSIDGLGAAAHADVQYVAEHLQQLHSSQDANHAQLTRAVAELATSTSNDAVVAAIDSAARMASADRERQLAHVAATWTDQLKGLGAGWAELERALTSLERLLGQAIHGWSDANERTRGELGTLTRALATDLGAIRQSVEGLRTGLDGMPDPTTLHNLEESLREAWRAMRDVQQGGSVDDLGAAVQSLAITTQNLAVVARQLVQSREADRDRRRRFGLRWPFGR